MRYATDEEIAWCNRLRRLMRKMPPTMKVFADGSLNAIPVECDPETTSFQPPRAVGVQRLVQVSEASMIALKDRHITCTR